MSKQTYVISECVLSSNGPEAIKTWLRSTLLEAVDLATELAMEQFEEPSEEREDEVNNDLNSNLAWFDDQGEWSVCISNLTEENNV